MTSPKSIKSAREPDILSVFLDVETRLRKYLMRFLIRKQDIEDVVQEAFLRSYNAEKTQDIQFPKSFIFKVAKNLALSEISRKSNQLASYVEDLDALDVLDNRADEEEKAIRQQELQLYINALRSLPAKCQQVFVMCKVYGFSHKEISSQLNISVSTVEKHLVKGLQRCHRYMQQDIEERDNMKRNRKNR